MPDEMDGMEMPDDGSAGIEACAQDLIDAVHAKDVQKVAQVLKDAFDMLQSQPPEELSPIEGIE